MHARLSIADLPLALQREIDEADKAGVLCPPKNLIFRALEITPLNNIKVVILGQDPYYTPGKASGLAFGHHPDYKGKVNLSLRNIFNEVERSTGYRSTADQTLDSWAYQGVLLLNTCLTTVEGKPNAHQNKGWEKAIYNFLERLQDDNANMVFMLWGKNSQKFLPVINQPYNAVLTSSHPSPLSARKGFIGSNHFTLANSFLILHQREPIVW